MRYVIPPTTKAHFSRRGFRNHRGHFVSLFDHCCHGLTLSPIILGSSLLPTSMIAVVSSPAERRIAATKSKVPETRHVVCRVSLRPAHRPPGAAVAAKWQRAQALLESAELTLGVMTFPSEPSSKILNGARSHECQEKNSLFANTGR